MGFSPLVRQLRMKAGMPLGDISSQESKFQQVKAKARLEAYAPPQRPKEDMQSYPSPVATFEEIYGQKHPQFVASMQRFRQALLRGKISLPREWKSETSPPAQISEF